MNKGTQLFVYFTNQELNTHSTVSMGLFNTFEEPNLLKVQCQFVVYVQQNRKQLHEDSH